MPTAAKLNFTPLTDTLVWFANYQAWNAYLNAITVNIGPDSLPEATVNEFGSVKMAASVVETYTVPNYGSGYWSRLVTDNGDGTQTMNDLATKACVDQLILNVAELRATVAALLAAMKTAGTLQTP